MLVNGQASTVDKNPLIVIEENIYFDSVYIIYVVTRKA